MGSKECHGLPFQLTFQGIGPELSSPRFGEHRDLVHRRVRIIREQVRMMGFTVCCPGFRAVNRNLPAVNHNEVCAHACS